MADPVGVSPLRRRSRPSVSLCLHAIALLACLPVALAGCSDDADGNPGGFRVAKAVLKSLLSGSDEAGLKEASPDEASPGEASPGEREAQRSAPAPESALAADPEPPKTCVVPYSGPVTIIAATSPNVLRQSVAERRGVPLVYETDDTAIWEDGRVMTLDVENVGNHLNAVGWAENPMQIMGAGTRPAGSSGGWSAGDSQFAFKSSARKTRRRG